MIPPHTLRQTYAGLVLQGLISRLGTPWRADGITEAELATRALKCADVLVDMERRSASLPTVVAVVDESYLAHSPSTTLHNPDNITLGQLQAYDGWRLLFKDEIKPRDGVRPVYPWSRVRQVWSETKMCGSQNTLTYRTKLCRADLANLS